MKLLSRSSSFEELTTADAKSGASSPLEKDNPLPEPESSDGKTVVDVKLPRFGGFDQFKGEEFIRTVYQEAHRQGFAQDADWCLNYAISCLDGEALGWYTLLDWETQRNWSRFKDAFLARYSSERQMTFVFNVSLPTLPEINTEVIQQRFVEVKVFVVDISQDLIKRIPKRKYKLIKKAFFLSLLFIIFTSFTRMIFGGSGSGNTNDYSNTTSATSANALKALNNIQAGYIKLVAEEPHPREYYLSRDLDWEGRFVVTPHDTEAMLLAYDTRQKSLRMLELPVSGKEWLGITWRPQSISKQDMDKPVETNFTLGPLAAAASLNQAVRGGSSFLSTDALTASNVWDVGRDGAISTKGLTGSDSTSVEMALYLEASVYVIPDLNAYLKTLWLPSAYTKVRLVFERV